jgi:hypothetical protein
MRKLLLLSLLVATVAIPKLAAQDPRFARGFKRAVFGALIFEGLYVAAVSGLYLG